MSELTKLVAEIAALTLKNLSDALLQSASEIRKLNHTPEPLSQTKEKPNLVSSVHPELTKRDKYKLRDRILVKLDHTENRSLMTISEILEGSNYMAYHWQLPKNTARKITHDQILGLDPNR